MPYQTVSINLQPQLLGVADEFVSHAEVKDAFCRCQYLGFHTVFCHHTVKVFGKYGVCLRNLTVTLPLVHGSTYQAILAHGILQSLLCHECQRHHGQTNSNQLFLIHDGELLFQR